MFGPIMRFTVEKSGLDIELAPLKREEMPLFVADGGMQSYEVLKFLGRTTAAVLEDEYDWFDNKARKSENDKAGVNPPTTTRISSAPRPAPGQLSNRLISPPAAGPRSQDPFLDPDDLTGPNLCEPVGERPDNPNQGDKAKPKDKDEKVSMLESQIIGFFKKTREKDLNGINWKKRNPDNWDAVPVPLEMWGLPLQK